MVRRPRIESTQSSLCSPVRLELLYSARGQADYATLRVDLTALPELTLSTGAARRAEDVQGRLSIRGHHRGPTPIDLYIAAVAEVNGVTLLHYDRHFDAIARITGQAAEWIAPRGSLDGAQAPTSNSMPWASGSSFVKLTVAVCRRM